MIDNVNKIGNLYSNKKHQSGNIYSIKGIAPTLCGGCHSYGIPFILIGEKNVRNIY